LLYGMRVRLSLLYYETRRRGNWGCIRMEVLVTTAVCLAPGLLDRVSLALSGL
jgi:hypothetical protein